MPTRMKEIEDSEVDDVVAFHNLNLGDKRAWKQWIWEYKSNYSDLFVFTILKDDGKVVGSQGMIPIYLNIRGETCLSGKSEDSLLDPKYRGGDRFKELYDFALSLCRIKGMNCIWGFTSAIRVWRNKLGFSVYEDAICRSILILKPRQFVSSIRKSNRNMVKKTAISLGVVFLYLYSSARNSIYRRLKRTQKAISIEQKLKSIDDLDKLYGRLRTKYADLIHIEQDEKYITWRVFNNPNVKYTTFFAYRDRVLEAYCYVALTDKKEAYISDLTFENCEAGNLLLKRVFDLVRKKEIIAVYFIGNIRNPLAEAVFNLLSKNGFVKRNYLPFILRNLSYKDENHLYDMKNWYINGLWTEGYVF